MRIIKQPKAKNTAVIRATCAKCKTLFEFEPHEARLVNDSRDGDFYHVDCPGCRAIVTKAVNA